MELIPGVGFNMRGNGHKNGNKKKKDEPKVDPPEETATVSGSRPRTVSDLVRPGTIMRMGETDYRKTEDGWRAIPPIPSSNIFVTGQCWSCRSIQLVSKNGIIGESICRPCERVLDEMGATKFAQAALDNRTRVLGMVD
jgi:hypothetical protein